MAICKQIYRSINSVVVLIAITILLGYRLCISPFMLNNCRFYTSCSQYSINVLKSKGFIIGIFYVIKRLLCCHSFYKTGNIHPQFFRILHSFQHKPKKRECR